MLYMFCANGVEECEALITVDMLRRAGIDVTTVGVEGKTVKGAHGIDFTADALLCEITENDINSSDGVILPGGGVGTQTLADNSDVVRYTKASMDSGKSVCAICAAPSVLGRHGMLKGKKATCYPGFEGYLEECEYTGQSVNVCGNVITAKGMGCAIDFSAAIIRYFKGEEVSRKILGEIMYAGE